MSDLITIQVPRDEYATIKLRHYQELSWKAAKYDNLMNEIMEYKAILDKIEKERKEANV